MPDSADEQNPKKEIVSYHVDANRTITVTVFMDTVELDHFIHYKFSDKYEQSKRSIFTSFDLHERPMNVGKEVLVLANFFQSPLVFFKFELVQEATRVLEMYLVEGGGGYTALHGSRIDAPQIMTLRPLLLTPRRSADLATGPSQDLVH